MIQLPIHTLESAVLGFGLFTLATAAAIYLLMEFHFRRQLGRETRRLILTSRLSAAPEVQNPHVSWPRGSRSDRKLIVEVLVDQYRSADTQGRLAIKKELEARGIYKAWIQQLRSGRAAERVSAASNLGRVHDPEGVRALVTAAGDHSPRVRLAVTVALGRLGDPAGIDALVRIAESSTRIVPEVTLSAALASCGRANPHRLAELLSSKQARQRIFAAWALAEVAEASILPQLLATARDEDPEVRATVARALARIRAPASLRALIHLAKDPVWFVRVRALDGLGEHRDAAGESAAWRGLEDSVREVRFRAASALRRIQGMKAEVAAKVLVTVSRAGFDSLISEWDRAGFLWNVVGGLTTGDWMRHLECVETVKTLIEAGITRALLNFMLVFPDIKIRLRLVHLFLEGGSAKVRSEMVSAAKNPCCDRRVAARIKQAMPELARSSVAGPPLTWGR